MSFAEFDCLSNFINVDFLNDIVLHSQTHGNQKPSHIGFVCDGIAASQCCNSYNCFYNKLIMKCILM